MNKRGLSQVVTTIILILLIIAAIAGIWVVVNKFVIEGSERISLDKFTIDVVLRSANVDFDTGVAEVRVRRNAGEGNLTGIKFIVEDSRNSDVFEERFTRFPELAEKTFELNLTISEILVLEDIEKIYIAPIYISDTGKEVIGMVSEEITGLNKNLNNTEEEETPQPDQCSQASDCGIDYWIESSEICSDDEGSVLQYKKTYACVFGFCVDDTQPLVKEDCIDGEICYDGTCIAEEISCTTETVAEVCGTDGWQGIVGCSETTNATVQDYKTYSCVSGICDVSINTLIRQECPEGEICFNGECFVPVECVQNGDCDYGEVCKEGSCVTEVAINTGIIRSAWPYGVGEYFDSSDLPLIEGDVLEGNYVIFPESQDTSCYQITSFVIPNYEGGISYIQLDESKTLIEDNDQYQVWETNYACDLV